MTIKQFRKSNENNVKIGCGTSPENLVYNSCGVDRSELRGVSTKNKLTAFKTEKIICHVRGTSQVRLYYKINLHAHAAPNIDTDLTFLKDTKTVN